ncbi:MAG: hypothetical protein RMM58_12460 [Chloroflexota bacterium]|nr:hypothetical protein [Dehalococcoidia bacterium]MDW8254681.1 hypothetical protein [Chloroflexota bacterium]
MLRWACQRAAGWTAIAVSSVLVVVGLTTGSALPLVVAAPFSGPYGGPTYPAPPGNRVVLPLGLKNAPLATSPLGYAPPPTPTATRTATPTPRPATPTPTRTPTTPYRPPR